MKKTVANVALALSLISTAAMAEERAGDAALGALSGAVVLGPIGAVAGAVVGYTAGPSISRSWGLRSSSTARHARQPIRREAAPAAVSANQPALNAQASAGNQAGAPKATQAPPPATNTASTAPPAQTLE
jgi:hypothetical protein